MSINIGIRIEFYDNASDKFIGAARLADGFRVCVVPQPGDRVLSVCLIPEDAESGEFRGWWSGHIPFERVHHLEHEPALSSSPEEPGVTVVIHTTAPGDSKAPGLVRAFRAAGWKLSATLDDIAGGPKSAFARAVSHP